MYLRGVQFSEMESIIQFIYLGEAMFCEERIEEFFAVAKSLEIKELCNADNETKGELKDEYSLVTSSKILEEHTVQSDHMKMQAQEIQRKDELKHEYTLVKLVVPHMKMQAPQEIKRFGHLYLL